MLISFENEHILIWRGQDWKSSLPTSGCDSEVHSSSAPSMSENEKDFESDSFSINSEDMDLEESDKESLSENRVAADETASDISISGQNELEDMRSTNIDGAITVPNIYVISEDRLSADKGDDAPEIASSDSEEDGTLEKAENLQYTSEAAREEERVVSPATEGVMLLLNQAIENGAALIMEGGLDADIVYKKAVSFAQTAPAGPVFRHRPKRVAIKKADKDAEEVNSSIHNEAREASDDKRKNRQKDAIVRRKKDSGVEEYSNVVPHGSLRVDELAKLLA